MKLEPFRENITWITKRNQLPYPKVQVKLSQKRLRKHYHFQFVEPFKQDSIEFNLFFVKVNPAINRESKRKLVACWIRLLLKNYYKIEEFSLIRDYKKYSVVANPDINISICISYTSDYCTISFLKMKERIHHTHDVEVVRKGYIHLKGRFSKDENQYVSGAQEELRFFEVWTKKEALVKLLNTPLDRMLRTNVLDSKTKLSSHTIHLKGTEYSICFAYHDN